MNLGFYIPTALGFYILFKAIKALDKINTLKKKGTIKKALVTEIREEINNSGYDEDGFDTTNYQYFYTVKFNDKRGRQIIQEIEFSVSKKPKKIPPFSMNIVYNYDDNREITIIPEDTDRINYEFYTTLFFGFLCLIIATLNYNGEINLLLDYLENLLK